MKVRVLLVLGFLSTASAADSTAPAGEAVLEHYFTASQAQSLKNASMDVDIDASLPKLKKTGRLHALRRISALGRITYEMLKFEGDGTVKNQVITRYLTAEAEAQKNTSPSIAVTPGNYKFKYKGITQLDGRDVHQFQVTPRQKRQGLFRGDVWIDAETYLRVQESGYLVKNPSIFLKKVAFVRKYEIRDGLSVPRQVQSTVDTWLVGKAELTIDFSNISIESAKRGASAESEGQ